MQAVCLRRLLCSLAPSTHGNLTKKNVLWPCLLHHASSINNRARWHHRRGHRCGSQECTERGNKKMGQKGWDVELQNWLPFKAVLYNGSGQSCCRLQTGNGQVYAAGRCPAEQPLGCRQVLPPWAAQQAVASWQQRC